MLRQKEESPEVKPPKDFIFPERATSHSKKIICNAWALDTSGHRDRFIGSRTVMYGDKYFILKIGREKKRFWINYTLIIEGKKNFEYHCNVLYANVGLSRHPFPVTKKVDSGQAQSMLQQGLIDFFINKGGMPYWYLLIAMFMVVIMAGVIAYIAPQFQQLTAFHEADTRQLQLNHDAIGQLRNQIRGLGGEPVA